VRVSDQEADADRQTALTIAISDDVLSAWRSVSVVRLVLPDSVGLASKSRYTVADVRSLEYTAAMCN
jgi:hypothetical protein